MSVSGAMAKDAGMASCTSASECILGTGLTVTCMDVARCSRTTGLATSENSSSAQWTEKARSRAKMGPTSMATGDKGKSKESGPDITQAKASSRESHGTKVS